MHRRVPQSRAGNGLLALGVGALDGDNDHAFGIFALHDKRGAEVRISRKLGPAVHPHGGSYARNQKQQGHARIEHNVAQGIDAVVPAPVGNHEGFAVSNPHETAGVAARAAVEPLRAGRGKNGKGRRLNELPVVIRDVVNLFQDGGWHGCIVKRLKLGFARYLGHLSLFAFAPGISYGTVLGESISRGSAMRKLPVFNALGHAFRSTTDNIGFAFHTSWPWMLMLLPLNLAVNLYLAFNGMQDPQNFNAQSLLLIVPLAIASIVAYCSIAVNWHRYVLLDEVAEGWQRLRIDSLMWRYIGNAILIGLVLFAGGFVAILVFSFVGWALSSALGEASLIVIVPGAAALYAYAIVSAYRLAVKLPSVALGRNDFSMGDAWRATAGNFWQILGLVLLFFICLLLVGLAIFVLTYVIGQMGTLGLSILIAIQVAVNWVATILGVTLLTSLYGFFVEGREF